MKLVLAASLLAVCSTAFANPPQPQGDFISTIDDFKTAYGDTYSSESMAIIEKLFASIEAYRSGPEAAIRDGFIPFTNVLRYHGYHWFDPRRLLAPPDPTRPAGLNYDEQGRLVAVFWGASKYPLMSNVFSIAEYGKLSVESQQILFNNMKAYLKLPLPTSFSSFGSEVEWHSHENVVVENLGARDSSGHLTPAKVNFRQSLEPLAFTGYLWNGLRSSDITLAIFEPPNPNLAPVGFNTLLTPGFHMLHMWVPLYNPEGLFAGTHPDVAPRAPDEHDTFVSGGHDHDPTFLPIEPLVNMSADNLAGEALAGGFVAVRVPGGADLCNGLAQGTTRVDDVVRGGLLFARISRGQNTETFRAQLSASLADRCSDMP